MTFKDDLEQRLHEINQDARSSYSGDVNQTIARNAIIDFSRNDFEGAYDRTVEKYESDVNFSDYKGITTDLVELLFHGLFTSQDNMKNYLGRHGISFNDEFYQGLASLNPDADVQGLKDSIEKILRVSELSESYVNNLTDVALETGKHPKRVLTNSTDFIEVIRRTYGSVEKYAENVNESITEMQQSFEQLSGILEGSLRDYISRATSEVIDVNRLEELGITDDTEPYISEVLSEIANFGLIFCDSYRDIMEQRFPHLLNIERSINDDVPFLPKGYADKVQRPEKKETTPPKYRLGDDLPLASIYGYAPKGYESDVGDDLPLASIYGHAPRGYVSDVGDDAPLASIYGYTPRK